MARVEVLAEVTGKVWKNQTLEGVRVNEDASGQVVAVIEV